MTLFFCTTQIAVALAMAWYKPEMRPVAFLFAFLAFLSAWAVRRADTIADVLRAQEEKLFKRIQRRLGKTVQPCELAEAAPLDINALVRERLAAPETAAEIERLIKACKELWQEKLRAQAVEQFELLWPVWCSKLRAKAALIGNQPTTDEPKTD